MTSPNYQDAREPLVQTVAIIQPQCMHFRNDILKRITDAGFTILQSKVVQLTNEQVVELFADQKHAEHFSSMQAAWTAGPILVMCLTKPKAIDQLKALLGSGTLNDANPVWPGCLRAEYASDDILIGIHGSEDVEHVHHEINFFFPDSNIYLQALLFKVKYINYFFVLAHTRIVIVEPLSRLNQESYLTTQIYPTLMNALYVVAQDRPVDPILTLATTLLETNPNRPLMEPAC